MGQFRPARWSGGSGKRSVMANTATPPEAEPAQEPASDGPNASDAARALAAEHNVDLREVTATGATGITKGDVETYIAANAEPEPEPEPEPESESEQQTFEPIPDEADEPPAAETA